MKSISSSSSISSSHSRNLVTRDAWRVTGHLLHPLRRVTRHLSLVTILLLTLTLPCAKAQTTQVLFPVNSLFGGAAYDKPITITAANTLISDGQNLWAGTYSIIPASTTNPVVSLYPNIYLMRVAGVVKPARFVVPATSGTNVLDVTTLLTSGPLFYFANSGLANLLAGTNIVFVTNSDGSITINWSGNSLLPLVITNASYATNAGYANFANIAGLAQTYLGNIGVAQITNLPSPLLTNGEVGVTLYGTFLGDGSGLYNLQSSSLVGTVPIIDLPGNVLTNFAGGVTLSGTFTGNGSGLTNLNARSLLVSNAIAIYPHLTGTNVFWSTIP